MNAKFIGIDGYGKIEKLDNQKSKSFAYNVKKFFKICSVIIKEDIFSANKKSSKNYITNPTELSKKFLKEKAIVTSLVAIMLCVVTAISPVFAAEQVSTSKTTASTSFEPATESETVFSQNTLAADALLADGYGLYIDGNLVGATFEKSQLEKALNDYLNEYKAKYDSGTTDKFANSVEIKAGKFESNVIDTAENLVNANKDKFSVSLETNVIMTEKVPFDTIIRYDDSKYENYKKTLRKGISSKQKVTYRVTYIDGEFADSRAIKTRVIKKGQSKIVVFGTKDKPAYSSASSSYSSSTGQFSWPVPYTRNITSYYGPRWGSFHYGIDIAASGVYGQSIVASDGGTVTFAGWDSSGYGNYIIIDHGNGYSTLYGHCSSVYVSTGQTVSKGQSIASVGSTGWSTGPHLHFEIRQGGTKMNPLNYL